MATKTDRILSYLPSTFRALPRPTALYSVVDAFGNELLLAENSLAAVMTAHWVDHADKGQELINDLACIAALYGLRPRGATESKEVTETQINCPAVVSDESVEEFREHLKRYVRTFLEGTVTVQGILRVTAEILALPIADDYDKMDAWWTRKNEALIDALPRGDDAARLLFGADEFTVSGEPARQARVTGDVDLTGGTDLRDTPFLRLKIDASEPLEINLTTNVEDASAVTLDEIVKAINLKTGAKTANPDSGRLTLSSTTAGPAARLEIKDGKGDAALAVLGLAPRIYAGSVATRAEITGAVDLSESVNLSEARYLRLAVDDKLFAEVDVAGTDATKTTLDDIKKAINNALGAEVASHDNHFLKLKSPTTGIGSRIALQQAAAQDARERLFGAVEFFQSGRAARSARVIGASDLSNGVDLSQRSKLAIGIDAGPALIVDCAGADPQNTSLDEIAESLNTRLGPGAATHDGTHIILSSKTTGPASGISVEQLDPKVDASEIILGIAPRLYQGTAATSARFAGKPDLSVHEQGLNLGTVYTLLVSVDGGLPHEIDLRSRVSDTRAVTPKNIVDAINDAVGDTVASYDGQHLILASPTAGSASRIAISPLLVPRRRHFVTRAYILNEAAQAVLGFIKGEAQGSEATRARITGARDLSRGVDLREVRYLRIAIDNSDAVEIDCAGERPRATLLDEIVKAINKKFDPGVNPPDAVDKFNVASASPDGLHLVLTSPTTGAGSRVAFELARATDASEVLFSRAPVLVTGREATRVTFVGAVDLSKGIDLSAADRIKLSIDGAPPVEISCASKIDPKQTRPDEIALAINLKLGTPVAIDDGARVSIISPSFGSNSKIEFAIPEGPDATKAIFGISPPRSYHGAAIAAAQLVSSKNLGGVVDLSKARFLRIAVSGGEPFNIDCAARAASADKATLKEITDAINDALKEKKAPAVASQDGSHLILKTTDAGILARLQLLPHTEGDAFSKLMGDVEEEASGSDATPAIITGTADLLTPVNLAERSVLRVATNSRGTVDIDVAGDLPEETRLDEIISKINAVFPGMASATEEDRLRLTAPTRGIESRLSVLPVRVLEVIEYPPNPQAYPPAEAPPLRIRHGDPWSITNEGAIEAELRIELSAPQGTVGPKFFNRTTGQYVHILEIIRPGERIEIWRDFDARLHAAIFAIDGKQRSVPGSKILAGPLKGDALLLPHGRSQWTYLDCAGARFNQARFSTKEHPTYFAGGRCNERAVFNISHFAAPPYEPEAAVFAPAPPLPDPPVEIRFTWLQHQPGAFTVNLPAELPERFGGRFNQARFGQGQDSEETYEDVFTEPEPSKNPDHVVTRINSGPKLVKGNSVKSGSDLIEATVVNRVPLGFEAVTMPFRKPRNLTRGAAGEKARIYLAEKDVAGFIELSAKKPGEWGNSISVTGRKSGPARFEVKVSYQGARFENARQIVLGSESLPTLAEDILRPGPVGILQAKAAGVKADVSRDKAQGN